MALFGLLRSPSVSDPILGALARSRGYWRGRAALAAHRDLPLLIAGGREAPDSAALVLARELPARYPTLQGEIGTALFEHYAPYREAMDAGELDEQSVRVASGAEVWPHVTPVHVIVAPLDGRLTIEIGYAAAWDIEHTLGAHLADWRLLRLNGSVRRVARS